MMMAVLSLVQVHKKYSFWMEKFDEKRRVQGVESEFRECISRGDILSWHTGEEK